MLTSYRVQQTRLEKEYAANCIETASNVHKSDVGDEVLQPEEPLEGVEGNTRNVLFAQIIITQACHLQMLC